MQPPRTQDLERYGLTDDLSTTTGSEISDGSHRSDGVSTINDVDPVSKQTSRDAFTSHLNKSFEDDFFQDAVEGSRTVYIENLVSYIYPSCDKEDDGTGTWYRAVQNTIIREGVRLDSSRLRMVAMDDPIRVVETGLGPDGRRVHVDIPVEGYMSMVSHLGETILTEIPYPGYTPRMEHFSPEKGLGVVACLVNFIEDELNWIQGEGIFTLIVSFLIDPYKINDDYHECHRLRQRQYDPFSLSDRPPTASTSSTISDPQSLDSIESSEIRETSRGVDVEAIMSNLKNEENDAIREEIACIQEERDSYLLEIEQMEMQMKSESEKIEKVRRMIDSMSVGNESLRDEFEAAIAQMTKEAAMRSSILQIQ